MAMAETRSVTFRGWPSEALEFYEGLTADNSKTYWTAHKAVYESQVLAPMEALLVELEAEFGAGKIFRPYRDVRFSADDNARYLAIAGEENARASLWLPQDLRDEACRRVPDPLPDNVWRQYLGSSAPLGCATTRELEPNR